MNVLKIWFLIISRWIKRAVKLKIKRAQNRREKEKNQQPKKEIKAKVITEVEIPETITVGEFASKMGKDIGRSC